MPKGAPQFFKSKWFKTDTITDQKLDTGTRNEIKDVQICRVGVAKGHGVNLEQSFVDKVAELGNAAPNGVKCRFGHPTMSSNALGTYIGFFKNFRVEGTACFADLTISPVAFSTPDGDLGSYVIALAKDAPHFFGNSIVFKPGDLYYYDKDGNAVNESDQAFSYDVAYASETTLYATIEMLMGSDLVDDGAATDGLFNQDRPAVVLTQFLKDHPEVFEFLSNNNPVVELLTSELPQFAGFLTRFQAHLNKVPMKKKPIELSAKAKQSLAKVAAKKTAFDINATTTDGVDITIVTSSDTPAVGDEVTGTAEDPAAPAKDGNHVINGGDLDGTIIVVKDGKIESIEDPAADSADPATTEALSAAQQTIAAQAKELARYKREAQLAKGTTQVKPTVEAEAADGGAEGEQDPADLAFNALDDEAKQIYLNTPRIKK